MLGRFLWPLRTAFRPYLVPMLRACCARAVYEEEEEGDTAPTQKRTEDAEEDVVEAVMRFPTFWVQKNVISKEEASGFFIQIQKSPPGPKEMLGASVKRAVQILPSTRNSQDLAPIYSMPTKQLEEEFNGLLDETLSAEAEPSSALIQNGAFFLSTNAWMAQETLGRILAIMHAEVLNSGRLLLMVDKA